MRWTLLFVARYHDKWLAIFSTFKKKSTRFRLVSWPTAVALARLKKEVLANSIHSGSDFNGVFIRAFNDYGFALLWRLETSEKMLKCHTSCVTIHPRSFCHTLNIVHEVIEASSHADDEIGQFLADRCWTSKIFLWCGLIGTQLKSFNHHKSG